jgi:hypothetical protein
MKSFTLLAVLLSSRICFSMPLETSLETSLAQHIDGDVVEFSNETELDKRTIEWTQLALSAACVRICPSRLSLDVELI